MQRVMSDQKRLVLQRVMSDLKEADYARGNE